MRIAWLFLILPLAGCLADEPSYTGPEITAGTEWVQGGPHSIAELQGQIVLVDFWTYSCINCLRTLPHLTAWYDTYSPYGFTIIGVHAPEFEFEKERENVLEAIARHDIHYPVVLDNEYGIWKEWEQSYWPSKYLLDENGTRVYHKAGEGGYQETENFIRDLLEAQGKTLPDPVETGDAYAPNVPVTRELYLGTWRQPDTLGNAEGYQPGQAVTYELPEERWLDHVFLGGTWFNGVEALTAGSDATLTLPFRAAAANFVAVGEGCIGIRINGEVPQGSDAGPDVQDGCIMIDEARSYDFYAGGYAQLEVELTVPDGIEIYTFAFSSVVQSDPMA